jgi:hypothetical protein
MERKEPMISQRRPLSPNQPKWTNTFLASKY